jgi:hypothetical protein
MIIQTDNRQIKEKLVKTALLVEDREDLIYKLGDVLKKAFIQRNHFAKAKSMLLALGCISASFISR